MLRLPLNQIRHVLCLGAHADDIEIGCGGTILKLLDQNPTLRVTWVVCAAEGPRIAEAQHAAQHFLGAAAPQAEILIRDFPDRYFPQAWSEIKDFFCELSDQLRGPDAPDLVFTHRLEDRHQDHRVLAELTWNAFRNHLILEYEIPKYEGDLGQPNLYVGLSEQIVDLKCQAIVECFPSQRSHPWFDQETFRSLMRIRGLEIHSPSRYAEAFYCRKAILE